jgi:hypothetical protein
LLIGITFGPRYKRGDNNNNSGDKCSDYCDSDEEFEKCEGFLHFGEKSFAAIAAAQAIFMRLELADKSHDWQS